LASQKLDFNIAPYHDDYNESKGFHKILYKPGMAVQARELNQMQTILQKQIERFGNNIFVPGTRVLGGQAMVDFFYSYVKLQPSFDGIASRIVGHTVVGETSGVKAVVIKYIPTGQGDPATLYVKYTSSGTDFVQKTFLDGENIISETSLDVVRAALTDSTGFGTIYTILPGVIFVKDHFVYHDEQNIMVEKYIGGEGAIINRKVGFVASEYIVDSEDDESLLDPALGASNYMAPGADRYVIDLSLQVYGLTDATDEDFIELTAIENGVIIRESSSNTEYSVLGDTLARRTYDANGSFTVRPYNIEIIEHLKSANATSQDGFLSAELGGNVDMFVGIVSPGKAYVMGYEVENIKSRYVPATKSRSSVTVNNGTIDTSTGNYIICNNVYSAPDLATLTRVKIYDRYTSSNGTSSGTEVGSCRIRAMVPEGTTSFRMYIFDMKMKDGYTFERNAKQLYQEIQGKPDFTCDITPTYVQIPGTISTTNGSPVITGAGTRFKNEISVGDYLTFDSGNATVRVSAITTDISASASSNVPVTITGSSYFLNTSKVMDSSLNSYIHELPYNVIKSVNPLGSEMNYNTRRVYDRTLTGGNVTITANTDETFAPYTSTNYVAINLDNGSIIDLTGKVARSGSPTGKNITFTLGLGSASVRLITTVQKSNSASLKKVKTLVENYTITLNTPAESQATNINLGRSDCFRLKSIKMDYSGYATPFDSTKTIDITSRYNFDDGQRLSHYDIGSLTLKQGAQKPTGPIEIVFDYFNHSGGDFFSVDSYTGAIDYKDIPTFKDGNKIYQLRDCLDFRPKIDANGIGFSAPSEFVSSESDIIADYEYYLPRIDKIVLDSRGEFIYVEGTPSLTPKEPPTPPNTMPLFILQQEPYVFDVKKDIKIIKVENKRYTMRDIGKLETRIKNLEYYVSLSLLERETATFQIKDEFGFDRFKNGIIVDQFSGHLIGDSQNPDYSIAMDFKEGYIRPTFTQQFVPFEEVDKNNSDRLIHHYRRTGNVATLPYTDYVFARNDATSRTENINPFSVMNWIGTLELDPPSDIWFNTQKQPTAYLSQEGNYNAVAQAAQNAGTWGTVWNNWQYNWYGNDWEGKTEIASRTGTTYTMNESIAVTTENDVEVSRDVIPLMRSVNITFTGHGIKPNTKLHAFFDNQRVTDFCRPIDGNIGDIWTIRTDSTGFVQGTFTYDADYFNFPNGDHFFRLTDSPTNSNDSETAAEAIFTASGSLVKTRDEVTSTRNGYITSENVYQSQVNQYIPPAPYTRPGLTFTDYIVTQLNGYSVTQKVIHDIEYDGTDGQLTEMCYYLERWANPAYYSDTNGAVDVPGILGSFLQSDGHTNTGAFWAWLNTYRVGKNSALDATGRMVFIMNRITEIMDIMGRTGTFNCSGTYYGWNKDSVIADIITRLAASPSAFPPGSQDFLTYRQQLVSNPNRFAMPSYVSPQGSHEPRTCWANDPLAQTFIVSGNPVYLTKIDLFFYDKDMDVPAQLEIRTVVNGIPAAKVVPFSRVNIYPNQVNISDDGKTKSTIYFDGLVYLEPGEYCIVLLTSSINYRMWISNIGEKDIITNKIITQQPFVGVLFKSQNASTWSPDQLQDLKFILYAAKFDNSRVGTIDFVTNPEAYQRARLITDPLTLYPNTTLVKVNHPKNGFVDGSEVVLSGLYDSSWNDPNANITIQGIDIDELEGQSFPVANVQQNSYTIDLPAIPTNNTIVMVGGESVGAIQDYQYDALYPAISVITVPGTVANYSIQTHDVGYQFRPFVNIGKGTTEFDSTKVLPSSRNKQEFIGNVNSMTFRVTIGSDQPFWSPIVDMQQVGGVFINNIVNNPTYESETSGLDEFIIGQGTDISLLSLSNTTAYVQLTDSVDRANAIAITKGTYLTINGSGSDGRYRVIDIVDAGANILLSGNIITENSGNAITLINGTKFVSEEAASGGSALSKYITKQFDFVNPSTSIRLLFDAHRPENTFIKVYYKTKLVGESEQLSSKEYIEITDISIKQAMGLEYYEIDHQVDNLPQFTSLILKIVLLSDNSARVPKVSALRAIVLA